MRRPILTIAFMFALACVDLRATADEVKVGYFAVDASPPIGSPMAYDPTKGVQHPLSCRGIVLMGEGKPIVLCAVDWIGIGNRGQTEFREALAKAAETEPARVSVSTLHQHDAPRCDFSLDELLAKYGIAGEVSDVRFERDVIARAAAAVKVARTNARIATHVGLGQAEVEKVASNRRILGPDGKVMHVRYTATKDAKIRAFPEGTIDRMLKMISFWNGDEPIVALTFYATHPQSYYRTGLANPDFPGMARDLRDKATGFPHVHFNGAGGNIGAGKYNDGSPPNRKVLADRVADGMERALKGSRKKPIKASEVGWEVLPVALPPSPHLDEAKLLARIEDKSAKTAARADAAGELIWLRRCKAGEKIDVTCLRLGSARVLNMPGELFVEYQLAAQRMRPDLFVAMTAYGDYGPCYIGTEVAYAEGGYETSPTSSLTAPSVEKVLTDAMRELLKK